MFIYPPLSWQNGWQFHQSLSVSNGSLPALNYLCVRMEAGAADGEGAHSLPAPPLQWLPVCHSIQAEGGTQRRQASHQQQGTLRHWPTFHLVLQWKPEGQDWVEVEETYTLNPCKVTKTSQRWNERTNVLIRQLDIKWTTVLSNRCGCKNEHQAWQFVIHPSWTACWHSWKCCQVLKTKHLYKERSKLSVWRWRHLPRPSSTSCIPQKTTNSLRFPFSKESDESLSQSHSQKCKASQRHTSWSQILAQVATGREMWNPITLSCNTLFYP